MLLRLVGRVERLSPQVRCYAVSVSPARIYTGKKMPRNFSVRKTFLYNQYAALLNQGTPLLFLNHKNFSAHQMVKLRGEIAGVKPSSQPLVLSPIYIPEDMQTPPHFSVIRTSIFGVALREHPALSPTQKRSLARLVTPGAVAVLTLPRLDPPQLIRLIQAIERAVPPRPPPLTPEEEAAERDAARLAIIENPTPGRRPKRVRPDLRPELELKGALIEGRIITLEELRDLSKLPTLDSLRAQILGLINAPASQLARVLGEAGGGQLARTLEGFKKGLEMSLMDANIGGRQ